MSLSRCQAAPGRGSPLGPSVRPSHPSRSLWAAVRTHLCKLGGASILLVALGAGGCGAEDRTRTDRPEGLRADLLISESDPLPCEVDVVPTGVRFRSDPDLSIPDVTQALARLPDGRFLSTTEAPGTLAEWASDGSYVRSFGGFGDGPEEFGIIRAILVDPPLPLVVLHPPGVTRLGDHLEVVERRLIPPVTSNPTQALFHPDGHVTFIGFHPNSPYDTVHEVDPTGDHVRSFRRVDEAEMEWTGTALSTARFSGSETFWVGPFQRNAGEWILQRWSREGELLETVRRQAEWLESPRITNRGVGILPRYFVSAFGDGVLMVWSVNWDHRNSTPEEPLERQHWDFIDTNHGRILASVERDLRPGIGDHRLGGFFPNQGLGTVNEMRADGLRDIVVAEVRLSCADAYP
jgi:hypothetical protein